MTVAAGSRLGPYEIVGPLGAGRGRIGPVSDFALSKHGRRLYAIENKIEADVWMATLK